MFIFDRHTNCCYFHHFTGKLPPIGASTLPNVYPTSASNPAHEITQSHQSLQSPRNSKLPPWESTDTAHALVDQVEAPRASDELPFDEEAKLIYGVIFSLRNMAKKLSGGRSVCSALVRSGVIDPDRACEVSHRENESFHSYSTSNYKLHYLHTPTSYHFVLLSSPMQDSLRPLLRQIYTGPFLEWVIRNPLVELDSYQGVGIDNEGFRAAVYKVINSARV